MLYGQPLPVYRGTNSGAPYYYPNNSYHPDLRFVAYHPIYNSSAARYCHEKNRDVNGDGIIDESEAEWYLPAIEQLRLIPNQPDEVEAEGYYTCWSSSEFDRGIHAWHKYRNYNNYYGTSKVACYSVRCIRDL